MSRWRQRAREHFETDDMFLEGYVETQVEQEQAGNIPIPTEELFTEQMRAWEISEGRVQRAVQYWKELRGE